MVFVCCNTKNDFEDIFQQAASRKCIRLDVSSDGSVSFQPIENEADGPFSQPVSDSAIQLVLD